ncbi:hypothetical protein BV898_04128 [Hypsibius exemplaris]|uniref:Uncharacterized protein n=1 Tax=Hypsibius exemplaris TaxID=2072580 RepID=A0A1W0X341_HYPEX|nr:hypothetical protein BV898_04128 [Hypsibius exemplaris]
MRFRVGPSQAVLSRSKFKQPKIKIVLARCPPRGCWLWILPHTHSSCCVPHPTYGKRLLFRGTGRATTSKNARHEACRDFVYCLLKNDATLLLETLANDTSFCPIANRAPNAAREGPTPAQVSQAPNSSSAAAGMPHNVESTRTLRHMPSEEEQSVPELPVHRQPDANTAEPTKAPVVEFIKIAKEDFEHFLSKVMPL